MDKYTFGDSKAAINLVKTLGMPEYSLCARKVSRLLGKQIQSINAIMAISDKGVRRAVLTLWRDRFINAVNTTVLPEIIKTHILCVATAFYRRGIQVSMGR